MKLIGSIYYNKEELIYSDDLIRFKQGGINQIPSEVDSEYLSDWAYFLSKPWSASNIKYITKINQAAKFSTNTFRWADYFIDCYFYFIDQESCF